MRTDEECHSEATAAFSSESSCACTERSSKTGSLLDSFETSLTPSIFPTEDVVYKGEGNANIVIALPHQQRVIRFRKSLPDEVSPDGGKTSVLREVGYARNVVSAFLGSYMQIPEIVRYDRADVTKLVVAIRHLRPETRRHKEITNVYALKFPDYTLLDPQLKLDESVFRSRSTFCVEIKPKQGFLQKTEWEKIPTCPYCLNQYTKLLKRNITDLSNYCPFDLFSGAEERMKNAVERLLKSPQNNLKIFKNGLVVYDQTSSPGDLESVLDEWFRNAATTTSGEQARVDVFRDLVYAALTRPFARERLAAFPEFCSRNFPSSDASHAPTFRRRAESSAVTRAKWYLRLKGKKCNFDGGKLPKDSVLERIWTMQRLSHVDVGYIYDIYFKSASLLNDDLIYSGLTKFDETSLASQILSGKCTVPQRTEAKVTCLYGDLNGNHSASSKSTLSSDTDKTFANGDFTSQAETNHSASSNCTLSSDTDKTFANGDFILQTETNLNSRPSLYKNRSHNTRANGNEQKTNVMITDQQLSALQSYLLFVMAKDCSILMTFRELHPESSSRVPAENTLNLLEQLSFACSVKVSDLDPKSVHSIKKHQQRDIDMFESVNSLFCEVSLRYHFQNR